MKKYMQKTIAASILTFKLLLLLNDNWKNYATGDYYPIRQVEKIEVDKMLSCMDPENGYTTYMCVDCGNTKKIPHSCKSRICSVCGKKHADEWAEKINKEMYAVPYRHIILTVTDRLWPYFEGNADLQKIMLDTAASVMKEIVKEHNGKSKDVEPGMIIVLHPFGKDLKTNMHVHMLMTEGGMTSGGRWVAMPYIDYDTIRKQWQYFILKAIRKAMNGNKEIEKIIDWCYKERKNGFNIQAKRRIEGKTKQAVRYMARYVRHPAIADGRIIDYDTNKVTFVYERQGVTHTVVMDIYEFIHNVIKHIPDKNFKMVRYYGIHSRRSKKSVRMAMEKLGLVVNYVVNKFSWRKNVKEFTGKDPLRCQKCDGEMLMYKVVYRDKHDQIREYGGINIFLNKILVRSDRRYEQKEEKEETWYEEKKTADHGALCLC